MYYLIFLNNYKKKKRKPCRKFRGMKINFWYIFEHARVQDIVKHISTSLSA